MTPPPITVNDVRDIGRLAFGIEYDVNTGYAKARASTPVPQTAAELATMVRALNEQVHWQSRAADAARRQQQQERDAVARRDRR